MLSWGSFCTPIRGHLWKPIDTLPAVSRKKVTAAFDGGRLSSDSGVILLSLAERRRSIAKALAALIDDPRDPAHITHPVQDVLRARMR
jgi:hypothetical protein